MTNDERRPREETTKKTEREVGSAYELVPHCLSTDPKTRDLC